MYLFQFGQNQSTGPENNVRKWKPTPTGSEPKAICRPRNYSYSFFLEKIICFEYKSFLWNRWWYDHLVALMTRVGRNDFYAPNFFNKMQGHIALGLSVRPSVWASVTQNKLKFWNFINRFVIKKIVDPYVSSPNYLPLWSYVPFKGS